MSIFRKVPCCRINQFSRQGTDLFILYNYLLGTLGPYEVYNGKFASTRNNSFSSKGSGKIIQDSQNVIAKYSQIFHTKKYLNCTPNSNRNGSAISHQRQTIGISKSYQICLNMKWLLRWNNEKKSTECDAKPVLGKAITSFKIWSTTTFCPNFTYFKKI